MHALHTIYVVYAPLVALCFVASWFVKDRGVAEKDHVAPPQTVTEGANTGEAGEVIAMQDVSRQNGNA